MAATFRVRDGFELQQRRAWVVRGDIASGTVRPGMYLLFPLNDGVTMSAEIQAVEFVDGPGGDSAIGLVLACEDDVAIAFWRGMTAAGELLDATDHDPAG